MIHVENLYRRLTPAHLCFTPWLPNENNLLSSCQVDIQQSPTKGKYCVAAKNLSPSDVVLKEEPFIQQLNKTLYKDHCYSCFRFITESPVHCHVKACRWNIIYCSRSCEKKTWSTGHAWLCRFPEFENYEEIIFAFVGYIKSIVKNRNSLPGLVSNNQFNMENKWNKIEKLADLFYLQDDMVDGIGTVLAQIKCNSFAIKQAASVAVDSSFVVSRESIHLGQAIYLSASKFNHSCDPNALAVFGDDGIPAQLQVKMLRAVEKGQEITISYGPLVSKHSKKDRKKKLNDDYYFDCKCPSCQDTSEATPDSIYKCQICRSGRLYRQQSTCRNCEQTPYWPHFLSTEAKIEIHSQKQEYLKVLQLQENIYHENVLPIGQTLDKLAQLYCIRGDMRSAAAYSKRSLQVTQKVFGKLSVESAEEMMKLSTLLFNSMQKPEAIKQINETIILYKILGLDKSAPEDIEELEELKNHLIYIVR